MKDTTKTEKNKNLFVNQFAEEVAVRDTVMDQITVSVISDIQENIAHKVSVSFSKQKPNLRILHMYNFKDVVMVCGVKIVKKFVDVEMVHYAIIRMAVVDAMRDGSGISNAHK